MCGVPSPLLASSSFDSPRSAVWTTAVAVEQHKAGGLDLIMRRLLLLLLVSLVCCCRGGRRSVASAATPPSQHVASSLRRVTDVSRVGPTAPSGPLTARGGGSVAACLPGWTSAVLAGGLSRSLAQALLYPVDALRTLAQTRDGKTLADVGVRSLVRGCAQTSSFALFTGGIQFGIFGAINPRLGPLAASVAGAAGSCLVSVPQEVIKQVGPLLDDHFESALVQS